MISDPLLLSWWESFLGSQKDLFDLKGDSLFPELTITDSIEGFHLLAKYDLLVQKDDGGCLIYDWKTYRKRPRRENIAQQLQTRVYPYLLIHSGFLHSQSKPVEPAQLSMIYWYANFPDQPEIFQYSLSQYHKDESYLSKLIKSIVKADKSESEDAFPLTDDTKRCLFCVYRSLCDRGVRAGDWDDDFDVDETQSNLDDFNFEHVNEVEF